MAVFALSSFLICIPLQVYYAFTNLFLNEAGVHNGGAKILSFFTLYFFGMLIGQDGWQRVFTARSVKVARNGGIYVGLYCFVYAIAGAMIGAARHAFLPPLSDPDLAFATIVNAVLPAGMRGLVLAASLAAIMSTASACLLAASTVLLEDVYLPLRKSGSIGSITQTRAITLVLGIAATVVACLTVDVIAALTVAYDLLVGAVFVPVLGAIMWRRGTGTAALASIAVGGITVVVLLFVKGMNSDAPIYGGLGLSLVVYLVLSLIARGDSVVEDSRVAGRT